MNLLDITSHIKQACLNIGFASAELDFISEVNISDNSYPFALFSPYEITDGLQSQFKTVRTKMYFFDENQDVNGNSLTKLERLNIWNGLQNKALSLLEQIKTVSGHYILPQGEINVITNAHEIGTDDLIFVSFDLTLRVQKSC